MKKHLSIVIMAHPKRRHFIPYLKSMLGEDVKVVFDRKNNLWDTCRRAWLAHDMSAKYAVVIQDDAIVCRNFRKRATAFLKKDRKGKDYLFSFYAGSKLGQRIEHARSKGDDGFESGMIYHEIALCMRTEHIASMVKYSDDRNAQADHEIGRWARLRRLPVYYSIPSLIDHRAEESLYRKINNKPNQDEIRKAYLYEN